MEEDEISGKEYTITASHPDYPNIESTIYLSAPSEPINIEYIKDARTNVVFFEQVSQDLVRFTIEDNPDEENYYLFQVRNQAFTDTFIFDYGGMIDTFVFTQNPFPLDLDVELLNSIIVDNNTLLLSDEGFNGQTIDIDLYSHFYDENYKNRIFEYRNITKSDFLFRQSFSTYQNAQDIGLFAEPVTLFNNVEGGFGLFSGEDIFSYFFGIG